MSYKHVAGVRVDFDANRAPWSPYHGNSHVWLSSLRLSDSNVSEVRFFCNTTNHDRVIHFSTTNAWVKGSIVNGSVAGNDYRYWNSGTTKFGDHSAYLPDASSSTCLPPACNSMFEQPFWKQMYYHWNIDFAGLRYECDDYVTGGVTPHDTTHQIWFRMRESPTLSAPTFSQVAKLIASDAAAGDQFGGYGDGRAVAVSGDTIVVGAPDDDDRGRASGSLYVFVRSGSEWQQQAKIVLASGGSYDVLGFSVSIDGDTIVAGSLWSDYQGFDVGGAYVFVRDGAGTWTQQAALIGSDSANYAYGSAVQVVGDVIAVGARGVTSQDPTASRHSNGAVHVFVRSGSEWTHQAKVAASDGALFDKFGHAARLDGQYMLVGAPGDDDSGAESGSAYVFIRSGSSWTQQAKLIASDGAAGDAFGYSVAIYGATVIVGAPGAQSSASTSGHAYIFIRSGSTWTMQAKLSASDGTIGDGFGDSVSLYGDTAIVGAYRDDDSGAGSGSAYVFVRSGSSWTQQAKLTANDGTAGAYFGNVVTFDGRRVVVAANGDDGERGAVYVFE